MAKKRLLIIDEDEEFCQLLKRNLEETGEYVVHFEMDPSGVLEAAHEIKVDVILLLGPDREGEELAQRIIRNPNLNGIPIISDNDRASIQSCYPWFYHLQVEKRSWPVSKSGGPDRLKRVIDGSLAAAPGPRWTSGMIVFELKFPFSVFHLGVQRLARAEISQDLEASKVLRQVEDASQRLKDLLHSLADGISFDLSSGIAIKEMKNSVATIQMGARWLALADVPKDDQVSKVLEAIDQKTKRANFVLSEEPCCRALQVLSPELLPPGPGPHLKPEDLNAVVRDAAKEIEAYAALRGIDLHLDLASELPLVNIELASFKNALRSLYANAINAMESVRPKGQLWVTTTKEEASHDLLRHSGRLGFLAGERMVVIRVEDDGPGFSDEALAEAFDPFFTEGPQREHSGLGLTTSLQIVEAHHGLITIGNRPSGGAMASIRLPI